MKVDQGDSSSRRPVRWRRSGASLSEAGFTLIELLIAMGLSVFVIGVGIAFITSIFHQQNIVTNRAQGSSQAEVGLQRLVVDLRDATNQLEVPTSGGTPAGCGTTALTGDTLSGVSISSTAGSGATGSTTLYVCVPAGGSSANNVIAPSQLVTWACPNSTTASYSGACTRKIGTGTSATEVIGVQALTLSPNVSGSGPFSIGSGSQNLSYVGIALEVQQLLHPDVAGSGVRTCGAQCAHPLIPLQTGVELRNA